MAPALSEAGSGNWELGACGSLFAPAPEAVMFHSRSGWLASAEAAALPLMIIHRQTDLVLWRKWGVPLCSFGFLFRGILRGWGPALSPFLSSSQSRFGYAPQDLMVRHQGGKAQTPKGALLGAPSFPNNPAFVAQGAQRR